MATQKEKPVLSRAYIAYLVMCVLGIAIIAKVFFIQVIEGDHLRERAANLTTVLQDIEAVRGNIYADDGSMMATSVPIYEIRMDLNADGLSNEAFKEGIDSLAICLAGLFDNQNATEWKRELVVAREKGARYHLVKRNVKYPQMKKLRDFPIFRRGKYRGGLIIEQQNRRERPFRMLAARTIGYERKDLEPVGLEGAYSKELSGVIGKRLKQKISGGEWMPLNGDNEVEPQDGYDLHTTINLNIQDVAENALLKQLQLHDADHGSVILMEVATGEIKAIANLSKDEDGKYWEYYNYAIGESAEPGSTFKLPSLMVAMEDNYVTVDDTVNTGNGTAEFGGETMRDSKKDGYGVISLKEAFAVSSNIGVMRVIEKHYKEDPGKFIKGLRRMDLGKPVGIEIEGEGSPLIKDPSDATWSGITYLWSSIGYEVKMTPLQVLTFYNAVANNGKMVKPRFIRRITDKSSTVKEFKTEVISESICSESTIKQAQQLLEAVVDSGTAKNLRHANYRIAGKTGTARIAQSNRGYTGQGRKISYQASFVGYFPAEKPQYSCIVVVNAPNRNQYYATHVAGPIFKEIADKVYSTSIEIHDELKDQKTEAFTKLPVAKNGSQGDLLRVYKELEIPVKPSNPENKWVVVQTGPDRVEVGRRNIIENLVPNVLGMSAQDALFLLENAGLRVELRGRGVIKKQSIQPGARIDGGERIILELA